MPPLLMIGVWEQDKYVGCVLFNRGANFNLSKPYGLTMLECSELCRVALNNHATPVTRILSVAFKFLRSRCPNLRLIVSFADPSQGHHGGIYQGGNWVYAGQTEQGREYFHQGKWKHSREVEYGGFGSGGPKITKGLPKRVTVGKHRYLMPLDDDMRKRIEPLRKPYPKRAVSIVADAPAIHAGEGGSIPTTALSDPES